MSRDNHLLLQNCDSTMIYESPVLEGKYITFPCEILTSFYILIAQKQYLGHSEVQHECLRVTIFLFHWSFSHVYLRGRGI